MIIFVHVSDYAVGVFVYQKMIYVFSHCMYVYIYYYCTVISPLPVS